MMKVENSSKIVAQLTIWWVESTWQHTCEGLFIFNDSMKIFLIDSLNYHREAKINSSPWEETGER